VPFDLHGRVVELCLQTVLEIEYKSTESRVGDEFIIRIIFIFITPLSVNLVAFGLIKNHPLETSKTNVFELAGQLFDQGGVLQTSRIYDLERVESLYCGYCAEVGQSFNYLAEVDLSINCIVDGNSYFV